jgi:hypothetical protein
MDGVRCSLKIFLFDNEKHFWGARHDFNDIDAVDGELIGKHRKNPWCFLHERVDVDVDFRKVRFF